MVPTDISLSPAGLNEFDYIYRLCEATMREYVEADLGDCFEAIAGPTIAALIAKGLFSTIEVNGERVGAVAVEQHQTHHQLEELYVQPCSQNQGVGKAVMLIVIAEAGLRRMPIRLHVLASNRARRFYERLGFVVTRAAKEVTYMERTS
jgi:ribosomal protein S18 acetylase RimI-like enzyme